MTKVRLLWLMGGVAFLFGIAEEAVTGRVDPFSAFGLAESLLLMTLIFWWYHIDKSQSQYRASALLNASVVAFTVLALPYYFFRSRGKIPGFVATLKALGFFALLLALGWLGEACADFIGS